MFDGGADDWGVTCRFNKIVASDRIMNLELSHIKKN